MSSTLSMSTDSSTRRPRLERSQCFAKQRRTAGLVDGESAVVAERAKRHALDASELEGWEIDRERTYGDTVLVELRLREEIEPALKTQEATGSNDV